MADDENGDKTEQPSDHRRTEVREQGNVVKSVDLNAAILMLAGAIALFMWGSTLVTGQADLLQSSLSSPAWVQLDISLVMAEFGRIGMILLQTVLPFLLILAAAALAGNLAQVGFIWSPEVLELKWGRLNPWNGIQRIFSMQALVKLAGSLAKLLLLGGIAGWYIWSSLPDLLGLSDVALPTFAVTLGEQLVWLAFSLAGTLTVLALADYGYQYWKFEQDLKMTKQEVRDELRQMEGDPMIRHRRREVHRKLVSSRQMQQVPHADVVVTNPTHIAVAIKYDPEKMAAPIIVAKGADELAERIRRIAAEHRVPIVEKKPLARALYHRVKVGEAIPLELYEVVAEVLAYVYRLSGKQPKS